jgi:hypothetical protein
MPLIPRGKRQIPESERKQFKQTIRREVTPDLTEAAVLQQAGKGLTAAADITQTLAERKERFKADKLTTQAAQVSSRLQDEMVGFTAEAMTRTGNDAIGIDEYNAQFDKSISEILKEQKLEGSGVGDVVRFKVDKFSARLKEKLANHQEKEQVTAALASVDSVIESNKIQATILPEMVDEIIAETIGDINAVAGIIGDEKAEENRKQAEVEIKENMISTIALTDMEEAEELLSQHRASLPKETIVVIEKEMSRIKKQAEADLKKAQEQAAEDWRGDFNKRLADGNPMSIPEIELAPIPEKEKTKLIDRSAKAPGRFEITDPIIYADISSRIDLEPDTLTQTEIWSMAGDGISTADAERLSKRLTAAQEKGSKENEKTPEVKNAKSILKFARKDGKFADDPQENDFEWARQEAALDDFLEQNPDGDPIEFIEKNLIPAQKGFVKSVVDFFSLGPAEGEELPIVEELPDRRRAIEALNEVGAPLTEGNISEAHRQLTKTETEPQRQAESERFQAGRQGL